MVDRTMQRLSAANPISEVPSPAPVDDLLARWEAAGLLDAPPSARRWRERLTTWLASGLLIAAVGTASAAAALTALTGSPLPPSADAFTVSPKPGTTRLSTVRADDPDGGPPWGVRVGAAQAGLVCLGVGQVQGNQLGLVGLDGVFRAVPPAGADDCGAAPGPSSPSIVQTRTFLGEPRSHSVTVVYGMRGPGSAVRVRYADGMTKVLPVGRDGTFVVARRGNLSPQSPRIEITLPAPSRAMRLIDLSPSSAQPLAPTERPFDASEAPR